MDKPMSITERWFAVQWGRSARGLTWEQFIRGADRMVARRRVREDGEGDGEKGGAAEEDIEVAEAEGPEDDGGKVGGAEDVGKGGGGDRGKGDAAAAEEP
jgi:hypothetical protein